MLSIGYVKKLSLTIGLLTLLFTLSSCNRSVSTKEEGLTVTDLMGRRVTLQKRPQRIVSLVPSATEILFEIGAGDKVIGVTEFDTYPEEVKRLPKVGGFKTPNLELLVSLKPDLVIISRIIGKEVAHKIESFGIPTLVLDSEKIDDMFYVIDTLGKITGREKASKALKERLERKFSYFRSLTHNLPKVKVLHIASIRENFVAGKGTFIDEVISIAGGENVVEARGFVKLSIEEVLRKNPDVIITSTHAGRIEDLRKLPGYRETNAVRNNRICIISSDDIIARPGPRIVLGIREVLKCLHPELKFE